MSKALHSLLLHSLVAAGIGGRACGGGVLPPPRAAHINLIEDRVKATVQRSDVIELRGIWPLVIKSLP